MKTTFSPIRTNDFLCKERSFFACYFLALTMSLLMTLKLFSWSFLCGSTAFFEQGDAAQHVSGWLLYSQDAWHFPLLKTTRLNYPEGASIAFTDSIPLMALPLKLIAQRLPDGFNYFGIWHAFVFIFQGLSACFLMRAINIKHFLGVFVGVFFALTWGSFLNRLGHTSLMTHGILILGFAFYLIGTQQKWHERQVFTGFTLLGTCALMVHPYFLAMVYPFYLAYVFDTPFKTTTRLKIFAYLALSISTIALSAFILGYTNSGGLTAGGFNTFSMNMRAPFCDNVFVTCINGRIEQKFEGFNSLGAGLIVLIAWALIQLKLTSFKKIKSHPTLTLLLLLFTTYSLSNQIFFTKSLIFEYQLPSFIEHLTGIFRASGRFFWPVGYVVLFSTLGVLLKQKNPLVVLLLIIALPLQYLSAQPLIKNIQQVANQPSSKPFDKWEGVLQGVGIIEISPIFGCEEPDTTEKYLYLQQVGAIYKKRINTAYVARGGQKCSAFQTYAATSFKPQILYVFPMVTNKNIMLAPKTFLTLMTSGQCAQWKTSLLCRSDASEVFWKTHMDELSQPTQPEAATRSSQTFLPAELPTQIGKLVDGSLVSVEKSGAGFLTFGPYINLIKGQYEIDIIYSSNTPQSQSLGYWDSIGVDALGQQIKLGSDSITGTSGNKTTIHYTIELTQNLEKVEFRTFFNGKYDLNVHQISIKQAS